MQIVSNYFGHPMMFWKNFFVLKSSNLDITTVGKRGPKIFQLPVLRFFALGNTSFKNIIKVQA